MNTPVEETITNVPETVAQTLAIEAPKRNMRAHQVLIDESM